MSTQQSPDRFLNKKLKGATPEEIKAAVVKAALGAVSEIIDIKAIVKAAARNKRHTHVKRTIKRKAPKPTSNVGLIYDYLLRHANSIVKSKRLEKLLTTRRAPGARQAGDAASVCSDINYLKKYYGFDIEKIGVGVYRLNKPTR